MDMRKNRRSSILDTSSLPFASQDQHETELDSPINSALSPYKVKFKNKGSSSVYPFGDLFSQRADYSKGLFYSGHRKFLGCEDETRAPLEYRVTRDNRPLHSRSSTRSGSRSDNSTIASSLSFQNSFYSTNNNSSNNSFISLNTSSFYSSNSIGRNISTEKILSNSNVNNNNSNNITISNKNNNSQRNTILLNQSRENAPYKRLSCHDITQIQSQIDAGIPSSINSSLNLSNESSKQKGAEWVKQTCAGVKLWINKKTGEVQESKYFRPDTAPMHSQSLINLSSFTKSNQPFSSSNIPSNASSTTPSTIPSRRNSADDLGTGSLIYDDSEIKDLFSLLDNPNFK